MFDLVVVLIAITSLFLGAKCESATVRKTANGPVEGVEETSSLGQKYYAFRGVPFAEPPISGIDPYTGEKVDRRFKAPVLLKRKWKENLNVTSPGKFCVTVFDMFALNLPYGEDCLYLNIYVPANGAEKKTVLVWIHGGIFVAGEPTDFVYGPDFLLSSDSIVVLVRYRLGIFGFLNLGTEEYSGNMGLKDQQMAMKWVYENIENFSGNKNEILLFGLSAGASSVHFHMLNSESRKYFNRAFLSSGTAFNYYSLNEGDHMKRMREFSKLNDTNELIEYLKSVDEKVINECHRYAVFDELGSSPWAPIVERETAVDAFLTMKPEKIYENDKVSAIDAVFDIAEQEYISFDFNISSEPRLTSKFTLPYDGFDGSSHPEEYNQALNLLRKAYFPDEANTEAIKRGNLDLLSELNFGYSSLKSILLQIKANGGRKNFVYRFSIDAGLSVFKIKYKMNYDTTGHADDLCYIFHCHFIDEFKAYDEHLKQRDMTYDAIMRMVKLITNFAKTGDPSIEGDTPFKSCRSSNEIYCQEISNNKTSSITTNILDQLHYSTWRDIEELNKKFK